ncbi:FG-GAP-like repeat-containing protein [Arthrobacter sp. UC242_113]|uniref:FG-GAP-like repeat-containing protein n=1 Tax=Arthrobacter sp. UC242_113 TaxID=3374550 RepID=UPI0037580352
MFSQSVRPKMPDGANRSGSAHRKSTTTLGRFAPAVAGALLAAALSPLGAMPANAATGGMGPVDSTGFPTWYSDGSVRLQLCYEAGKGCLSEPPNPDQPASYPGNFPEEAFWFAATADVGTIGSYEAALEAAHVNGPVVPGEQMGFARLRFRFDGLRPNAQYTITHPYGVETITADADGSINQTTDAGACAPTDTVACDWAGVGTAFLGDFGRGTTATFLTQVGAPAGTLGDINTARPVTGAPSGINSVTVAGPDAGGPGINTVTQSNFAVQGLIATDSVGGPNTPDLAAASDSGRSNSDNITNVTAPTITGTLPAGTAGPVQLIVDNGAPRATTLTGSTYSLKLAPLAQGPHTVQAVAGGLNSGTLNFTVDTTAPAVAVTAPFPSTPSLDNTPSLSFSSSDPQARFECRLQPTNQAWDTTCASPKTWDAQVNGFYTFGVRATDAAGNVAITSRNVRIGTGTGVTSVPQDFNGDGRADLVTRDSSGVLWTYLGNGSGTFPTRTRVGAGWNSMNSISATGDLTGDGRADLVARDSSGVLWTYRGSGSGTFPTRIRVGTGWNSMKNISAAADLNGDGRNDLLAVDAGGVLWSYAGNNAGTFPSRIRAGAGWNGMAISAAGDLNRDGKADLVARDSRGILWSYLGNAAGAFPTRVSAGAGWNAMNAISGAADLNGDGRDDLVARDTSGVLWSYMGNGAGTFPNRVRVGGGWNIMSALS